MHKRGQQWLAYDNEGQKTATGFEEWQHQWLESDCILRLNDGIIGVLRNFGRGMVARGWQKWTNFSCSSDWRTYGN